MRSCARAARRGSREARQAEVSSAPPGVGKTLSQARGRAQQKRQGLRSFVVGYVERIGPRRNRGVFSVLEQINYLK